MCWAALWEFYGMHWLIYFSEERSACLKCWGKLISFNWSNVSVTCAAINKNNSEAILKNIFLAWTLVEYFVAFKNGFNISWGRRSGLFRENWIENIFIYTKPIEDKPLSLLYFSYSPLFYNIYSRKRTNSRNKNPIGK